MIIIISVMVYLTIATVSISFLNLLNHCFSTIKSFFMISLPIRLSNKYQVNQINHEVGIKHHRGSTYNNPNVHIKTIEPYIYLVYHLFLLMYANTTKMANMMMTIICTGNYFISLSMVFLASPDSAK